jgi:hypothetical protein
MRGAGEDHQILTRPPHRAHIYLICSSRPRTGKTLIARLCAEFDRAVVSPTVPIDLGTGDPTLSEFLPGPTIRGSIADIRGQMALFDRLAARDGISKVVDIGSPHASSFFTIMRDIGFAVEAQDRAINTSILFIVTSDEASGRTYAGLREQFPSFTLVPVYNEIVAYGRDIRRAFVQRTVGFPALQIPRLPPELQTMIDTPLFSFAEFRRQMPADLTTDDLNLEFDVWLRRIFRQLRELELSILINDLRPVLTAGTGRETP